MTQNRHYIDEKTFVEDPLLDQLEGLGWQVLRLKSIEMFFDSEPLKKIPLKIEQVNYSEAKFECSIYANRSSLNKVSFLRTTQIT